MIHVYEGAFGELEPPWSQHRSTWANLSQLELTWNILGPFFCQLQPNWSHLGHRKPWQIIDFYWFSLIFIDFHWFSLIFNDFHWFSLIFIDFQWFSMIFIDFHWFWLILNDFYWLSQIFIDFDWFPLIFIDFHEKNTGNQKFGRTHTDPHGTAPELHSNCGPAECAGVVLIALRNCRNLYIGLCFQHGWARRGWPYSIAPRIPPGLASIPYFTPFSAFRAIEKW